MPTSHDMGINSLLCRSIFFTRRFVFSPGWFHSHLSAALAPLSSPHFLVSGCRNLLSGDNRLHLCHRGAGFAAGRPRAGERLAAEIVHYAAGRPLALERPAAERPLARGRLAGGLPHEVVEVVA